MKKDLEYTKMACFYDELYKNKNYKREVGFIEKFLNSKEDKILDAGCGTGNHAKILQDKGYNIYGFDLSPQMVEIANAKVNNNFEVANLLFYSTEKKFDLIISFYAVFNHLKSYQEFSFALQNLLKALNNKGTLIIDLHNPQKNGVKVDKFDSVKRIMQWKINKLLKKETSKITYFVGNNKYVTKHKFKIFKIEKIKRICDNLNLNCEFYENYVIDSLATNNSKNIQVVIKKNS